MTWQAKAGITAGVIILIAALAFIVKYQYDIIQQQQAIEKSMVEMKRLQDGVVRSQAKYVTKGDLESFAKNSGIDLDPIEKDIKKLGADLQGISRTLAKTPGFHETNIVSTLEEPRKDPPKEPPKVTCPDGSSVDCPDTDPFNYQENAQVLGLNEPFADDKKIPFGEVKFHAWRKKPWDVKILPREYSSVTVLSVDKDGRHYTHNKMTISVDGEEYIVPITNSEFVETYPESEFHFSPRLYIGVDGGTYFNPVGAEVVPNLQLALFSYGKTKVRPDWTFLGVGLGYMSQKNNLGFVLSPVNYNIASHIPFVENLFIGPTVSVDLKGNLAILGGLRVGL